MDCRVVSESETFLKTASHAHDSAVVLMRKVLKDFRFSDGTLVPAGMIAVAPTHTTHRDNEFLDDAAMFNPWRYSDMRDENNANTKNQMINPSNTYLPFGLGKHAW